MGITREEKKRKRKPADDRVFPLAVHLDQNKYSIPRSPFCFSVYSVAVSPSQKSPSLQGSRWFETLAAISGQEYATLEVLASDLSLCSGGPLARGICHSE